jgi:hypothetical protein
MARGDPLFDRLSAADLRTLAEYLLGSRWKAALSRELGVSTQLIGYWANGRQPVSRRYSAQIAKIARERHDRRVARERAPAQKVRVNLVLGMPLAGVPLRSDRP